jgi:hypothetical protein
MTHHNNTKQQKPKDTSDADWEEFNRKREAEIAIGERMS